MFRLAINPFGPTSYSCLTLPFQVLICMALPSKEKSKVTTESSEDSL